MWSVDDIAERFRDAAQTARRLPPVRVQGYFNTWPAIMRMSWKAYTSNNVPCCATIDYTAIERMVETTRWMLWLTEEQRHLVWMRAENRRWRDICRRIGCDRATARRRWQKALDIVACHLNNQTSRNVVCH